MSETEIKEAPSRTSGAVKALKSCWVTYSSVNEMLPEGMSRRDQGEMMKPIAAGSEVRNTQLNHWICDQEQEHISTYRIPHYLNSQPLSHINTQCLVF